MKNLDNLLDNISVMLLERNKKNFYNLHLNAPIYNDTCGGIIIFGISTDNKKYNIDFDWNSVDKINKTLLSLRDQILKETGKRIWGLIFTLYPDGKHEIEYDYNIPEGFNEKGEWIGEQDFGEVTEFFDNIRNIGTDKFELK